MPCPTLFIGEIKSIEREADKRIEEWQANIALLTVNSHINYIKNKKRIEIFLAPFFLLFCRFFNKTLTDVALINCLSALDLGKQYVAISEKACKQIKVLQEEALSQLELALLKDMSAERRKEGIALAEEIEVKYRREGKFFDEILKGE